MQNTASSPGDECSVSLHSGPITSCSAAVIKLLGKPFVLLGDSHTFTLTRAFPYHLNASPQGYVISQQSSVQYLPEARGRITNNGGYL